MRFFYTVLIITGLALGEISAMALGNSFPFSDNPVIAHRGAWKKNNFPQNSIASLKHAIELKCTGSEFDVRMTADDSLVINHDAEYNKLKVEKSSYAELAVYRLANGENLPTLREYIRAGTSYNTSTRLVCEIKPSDISPERGKIIAEKVVRLVKEMKAGDFFVFISFDYAILKRILELDPMAKTQYLEGDKTPLQLKTDGVCGADFHYSVYIEHPDWIEKAKENSIVLNAWTVNETAEMDWLLANKFDFVTTNEPELLLERCTLSPVSQGWKLAWSDEFNYNGLPDNSKWTYDVGGSGFGNNELQYYTREDTLNAVVRNGLLRITARKQETDGKSYTSARLLTKDKSEFKYGKIEVRAKLPRGKGTWPAIWMLGKNISEAGWPKCGEIDIMEHVGYEKDSIFGTIHSKSYNHTIGTQKVKAIFIDKPYDDFHVFSIEWTPDKIDFLMDNKVYNHIVNEHKTANEWPFDQPFFLILNLAIGGNWGGKYGVDDSIFPAVFEVDYVRVFKE